MSDKVYIRFGREETVYATYSVAVSPEEAERLKALDPTVLPGELEELPDWHPEGEEPRHSEEIDWIDWSDE